MKNILRILRPCLFGFLGLAASYILLICFPQPLFAYSHTWNNLTLYCDDPIPPQADQVLQDAQRRLGRSPFYANKPHENIFLCNHIWRYRLLFAANENAKGFAYLFAPWNVFLGKADISENVLFRKDGRTPSGPARPLSYFLAHEITHNLTNRFLGPWAQWRLPVWKREGYADYIGKGGDFDFKKNLALFKKGDPLLDPHASGLYLRYQLLVAYLLEKKGLTAPQLLTGSFDQAALEKEIRSLPD